MLLAAITYIIHVYDLDSEYEYISLWLLAQK